MPKVLRLDKGAEECVRELLRFLLESGKVKGVFTLVRTDKSGGVAYSLVTNSSVLEEALPLFPLMPINAAKVLSRLTLVEPTDKPIAAVVRPCELRALTELVKRSQGSLENLLFISPTCAGVYPLQMVIDGNIEEKLPQYWDAVKKGEVASDIRPACAACEHFVPYNADMTVALISKKDVDKQCEIFLNTDKAEQFVADMAGQLLEQEPDTEALELFRSKREDQRKKALDEIGVEDLDLKHFFGKCIGCRACSKVCPICYCHVCFFDSKQGETTLSHYLAELERKGYTQVLPDPLFYQLVRLFHVSISCVGCGLCADVCSANIPLWAVSLKTAGAVQEAFGYLPGRDVEEGPPTTTFKPEEFAGVE